MNDEKPVFILGAPRLEIAAHYSPISRGVELYIWRKIQGFDHDEIVTGFVVENMENDCASAPSCILSEKQAQRLMDDLWGAGLRPTNNHDVNATIREMQAHIDSLKSEIDWLRLRLVASGNTK